ncbi:hypothetical protein [Tenggerimyces flavus]|uniref:Uncharacterized protein n=1 Tax=Tenggerimyces flavus TaxID=1708749 RepID=A0ABV7YCF5_9ACTN
MCAESSTRSLISPDRDRYAGGAAAPARNQSLDELADGLQRRSGLLGLSGGRSNDTRELVRLAQGGSQPAALALDVFAYRAARELAAAAVALDRGRRRRRRRTARPICHSPGR